MTPYGQILKLHYCGLNNSAIAKAANVARNTVIDVIKRADGRGLGYEAAMQMSDTEIHRMLHPKAGKVERMPDLDACFYRLGLPGQSIAGLRSLYALECARRRVTPYSRSMFQNIIAEERHKYHRKYSPVLELLYVKDAVTEGEKQLSLLFYRHCDSGYASFTYVKDKETRTWIHSIIRAIRDIEVFTDTFRYLGRIPSKVRGETVDCISFYGMQLEEMGKKAESNDFRQWVSETIHTINNDRSDTSASRISAVTRSPERTPIA